MGGGQVAGQAGGHVPVPDHVAAAGAGAAGDAHHPDLGLAVPVRSELDHGGCLSVSQGRLAVQGQVHAVRAHRQPGDPHPGRVAHRVGQGRRHRVERGLAHRLRAERAERVGGPGEVHLGPRHVGQHRDVILPQRPRGHLPRLVDVHVLEQRRAERLAHAALDLAAQLHRVDDRARVGGLHALQDGDLAGRRPHRDPEALHVEGDRPAPAVAGALGLQQLPVGRRPGRAGPPAPGRRAAWPSRPPPCRWTRRPRCRARPRRCRPTRSRCRPRRSPARSRRAAGARWWSRCRTRPCRRPAGSRPRPAGRSGRGPGARRAAPCPAS